MFYIPPYFVSTQEVPLFNTSLKGIAFRFIEQAARVCYKSEANITNNSFNFLNKLFKSKHLSVFEHSNFVVRTTTKVPSVIRDYTIDNINRLFNKNIGNRSTFLKFNTTDKYIYIGGNLRAWLESLDMVKLRDPDFSEVTPTKLLEKLCTLTGEHFEIVENSMEVPPALRRFSAQIVHDRAFTHELVRHRVMSFSQESQRYCNYKMNRFGSQITFIEPPHLVPDFWNNMAHRIACWVSEKCYMFLIKRGIQPQIARSVLPNATKTEIVISGDKAGWEHLFSLRCGAAAHPDMKSMMYKIQEKFQELKSWESE